MKRSVSIRPSVCFPGPPLVSVRFVRSSVVSLSEKKEGGVLLLSLLLPLIIVVAIVEM